jgi:hypothetical protein
MFPFNREKRTLPRNLTYSLRMIRLAVDEMVGRWHDDARDFFYQPVARTGNDGFCY